jgi:hypothetical protein
MGRSNCVATAPSHQPVGRGASANRAMRILREGKRREPRGRGGFRRLVLALWGLTGLLNPSVKFGTKLFQPYFMNCFNCASPGGPV